MQVVPPEVTGRAVSPLEPECRREPQAIYGITNLGEDSDLASPSQDVARQLEEASETDRLM